MSISHGYAGLILRINLSSGSITRTETSGYADRFVGGRGIGSRIYWDEISPKTTSLDPENRLIIVTGPLGGLAGLSGSMWQIYSKSPVSERFSYSNFGGHWGAHLKFAGFDGIVISGRSEEPVYVLVRNGEAQIRSASHLWGKGAVEVRRALKAELGESAKVLATGPAGDNLVSFANIIAENDASGGSGFGAVMGSKKLKAVVVAGSARVPVARPDELHDLVGHVRGLNRDKKVVPMTMYVNLPGVKEKPYACYGCICGCPRVLAQTDDGERSKRFCHSGSFYQERVRQYYGGYNDVVVRANRICDEYGVETRTIDSLITWLSTCYQAGQLTDENTGIPLSKTGSLEFIETLARKIALREGFGEILAQGPAKAAQAAGIEGDGIVVDHTSASRAQVMVFDPRTYMTTGIIYAMEPRRAMWQLNEIGTVLAHWVGTALKETVPLDSYRIGQNHPFAYLLKIDDPEATREAIEECYVSGPVLRNIAQKFWGSKSAADFSTYEGKALAAKKIQDRSYAKECLVLCTVLWPITHDRYSDDHLGDATVESKLLSAVTGGQVSPEELEAVGERCFNLTRAILVREGRGARSGDRLPDYCFTSPVTFEAYNPECLVPGESGRIMSRKGAMLDRDQFSSMFDEYYRLRGWDAATGLQTRTKLNELGLSDVASNLAPGLTVK